MGGLEESEIATESKDTKSLPRLPSIRLYQLPFYGRIYRGWSKFIHKHGYHYAPKQYPPQPHEVRIGLGGYPIKEWYHWCQWCGLRGTTLDTSNAVNDLELIASNAKTKGNSKPPKEHL